MNWRVWREVEAILRGEQLRPILAVVPDNQDPMLRVGNAEPLFWQRVRDWEAQGWTIAMHGWQHRFVSKHAGVLGINRFSEFAGLLRDEQEEKLRLGLAVFNTHGLNPSMFVAPAHSFDEVTLELLNNFGFRYLSDGFFPFPHVDNLGLLWIPQQLWEFRQRPFGVWTICFHINNWRTRDIARFATNVQRYRKCISDVTAVASEYGRRRNSMLDSAAAQIYRSIAGAVSRAKTALRHVPA
jgi:peptidoglycan/xylan/chitin deacetylase (PgdA/CDA1 family)